MPTRERLAVTSCDQSGVVAQPRPRVRHGVARGAAGESRSQRERGIARVEARHVADRRHPDRQLRPGLDLVLQQELRIDPGERRGRIGDLVAEIENLRHRGVARTAQHVDRAVQRSVDGEGREISRIDVLHREVLRAGCEHVAAGRDATQPPGQTPDVLARSEDQPGSCEDAALGAEHALDGKLGTALVGGVVGCAGVGARVDSLRRLGDDAIMGLCVHRDGRDVDVARRVRLEFSRGLVARPVARATTRRQPGPTRRWSTHRGRPCWCGRRGSTRTPSGADPVWPR